MDKQKHGNKKKLSIKKASLLLLVKEMSLCHKLKFSNHYILEQLDGAYL